MIDGIQDCKHLDIIVRIIVSLDRRHSLQESMETLDAALALNSPFIVGIDLCGDPTQGDFETFEPVLQKARLNGLQTTLHFGEVPNREQDNLKMLKFRPDRLSHCINFTKEMKQDIIENNIPIEICLTSNLSCKAISDISVHHFPEFYGHVGLALSTDDVGIFHSNSSDEYRLCGEHYGLSKRQVFELSRGVIDLIFADDCVKQELKRRFLEFEQTIFN